MNVRGEVSAHKTNLTLPLFIEVSLPSQESEWSCICVLHEFQKYWFKFFQKFWTKDLDRFSLSCLGPLVYFLPDF
jgi:hypothetical protein